MATSEADVTVRLYRPGDEETLLETLEAAFDGWPGVETTAAPIDHLRWKLAVERNAPPRHILAEIDSRIVGARLFFSQGVKVGDRVYAAGQEMDGCVHPERQGRGVMWAMVRWGNERVNDTFEMTFSVRSGNPAIQRLNEEDDDLGFFAKIAVLEHRLDAVSATPVDAGGRPWTLRAAPSFDERVDEFWKDASVPFALMVARPLDELNWRYADPRAGRYAITLAEDGERLLGYSVLATSHGRGYVADLLALPDRLDVVESLARDAVARARREGVAAVECWSPKGHPYEAVLRREGFDRKRRTVGVKFLARGAPRAQFERLEEPHAVVHLMAGDTDLV